MLALPSQPTVSLDISSIAISDTQKALIVTVTAAKTGRATDASVEVLVVAGGDPNLTVELVAQSRAIVVVKHMGAAATGYAWGLGGSGYLGGSTGPASQDAPAGFTGAYFILNMASGGLRALFAPGGRYTVTLAVNGKPGPSLELSAPSVPTGGSCITAPLVATEMVDEIVCTCSGWSSDELPISYSVRVTGGEWSSPSFRGNMPLLLLAGTFEISGRATDAAGGDAVSPGVTVQVIPMPEKPSGGGNSSGLGSGSSALDSLEGVLGQMSGTGNVGGLLTAGVMISQGLETAAGDPPAAGGGNRSSGRRLLGSSAAYRMRTRRMLLKAMSGASGASSGRLASSSMGAIGGLTRVPSEVDPSGAEDAVAMFNASAGNIDAMAARSGGLKSALVTMGQLITISKTKLPKEQGFRVLLAAIESSQLIAQQYVSTMLPPQGAECFPAEGVLVVLRRMNTEEYGFDFAGAACLSKDEASNASSKSARPNQLQAYSTVGSYGLGVVTFVTDTIWKPPQIAVKGLFSTGTVGFIYDDSQDVTCPNHIGCAHSTHIIDLARTPIPSYSRRDESDETIAEHLAKSSRRELDPFELMAVAKGIGVRCWMWNKVSNDWISGDKMCRVNGTSVDSGLGIAKVHCSCNDPGYYMVSFEPPERLDLRIQIDACSGHQSLFDSHALISCVNIVLLLCCGMIGWMYIREATRRFTDYGSYEYHKFVWAGEFDPAAPFHLPMVNYEEALAHHRERTEKKRTARKSRRRESLEPGHHKGSACGSLVGSDLISICSSAESVDGHRIDAEVGGIRRTNSIKALDNRVQQFLKPEMSYLAKTDRKTRHNLDIFYDSSGFDIKANARSLPDQDGLFWQEVFAYHMVELDETAQDWRCWLPSIPPPDPYAEQLSSLDLAGYHSGMPLTQSQADGSANPSQPSSVGDEGGSKGSSETAMVDGALVPSDVKKREIFEEPIEQSNSGVVVFDMPLPPGAPSWMRSGASDHHPLETAHGLLLTQRRVRLPPGVTVGGDFQGFSRSAWDRIHVEGDIVFGTPEAVSGGQSGLCTPQDEGSFVRSMSAPGKQTSPAFSPRVEDFRPNKTFLYPVAGELNRRVSTTALTPSLDGKNAVGLGIEPAVGDLFATSSALGKQRPSPSALRRFLSSALGFSSDESHLKKAGLLGDEPIEYPTSPPSKIRPTRDPQLPRGANLGPTSSFELLKNSFETHVLPDDAHSSTPPDSGRAPPLAHSRMPHEAREWGSPVSRRRMSSEERLSASTLPALTKQRRQHTGERAVAPNYQMSWRTTSSASPRPVRRDMPPLAPDVLELQRSQVEALNSARRAQESVQHTVESHVRTQRAMTVDTASHEFGDGFGNPKEEEEDVDLEDEKKEEVDAQEARRGGGRQRLFIA